MVTFATPQKLLTLPAFLFGDFGTWNGMIQEAKKKAESESILT